MNTLLAAPVVPPPVITPFFMDAMSKAEPMPLWVLFAILGITAIVVISSWFVVKKLCG